MLHPKQKKFCEMFAAMFREERAKKVTRPRVGRRAALLAGYGETSWCETNVVLTADSMYHKLIRREDILAYLQELGIERDGRDWRDTHESQPVA